MKEIAPNTLNKIVGGALFMFQISKTGGFIDLGDLDENSIQRTVERGEYKSSRSGTSEKVYSWLQGQGLEIKVKSSDIVKRILQLQLGGTTPANQSQTASSVTDEAFTAKLDRWVAVAKKKISSVVVTNSAGSTTYVEGTAYEVDYELGMIRCLSTGTITADQSLLIDYSYAATTSLTTMDMMQTLRFTGDGWLKWIAENGARMAWYIPLLECQSDEPLKIVTANPAQASFTFKAQKDTTQAAGKEWGTFYELTAAT